MDTITLEDSMQNHMKEMQGRQHVASLSDQPSRLLPRLQSSRNLETARKMQQSFAIFPHRSTSLVLLDLRQVHASLARVHLDDLADVGHCRRSLP